MTWLTRKRARLFPWRRLELERLEERLLLAADLLVTVANRLQEYQLSGALVSSISVPNTPVPSDFQQVRGLTVDSAGKIDIYNGTFNAYLATYSRGTQTWTQQTYPGWSTVNNGSYGGVAAFQNYVFATDMATGSQTTERGLIRFDFLGGPTVRFANTHDFIDVTMGLDGLLYADDGQSVFVYDPLTLAPVRNFNLPFFDDRSIAVDSNGNILVAVYAGTVAKLDPSGTQVLASTILNSSLGPGDNLVNLALDNNGQVAVGDRFGRVFVTDESLASVQFFQVQAPPDSLLDAFVTFNHYIPSNVIPRNPIPAIGGLSQSSAAEGSGSLVLTLTGTGFTSSSTVQWNGQALATSFVSPTQVQATIPAADLADESSANITVFNPAPGGGTSNIVSFSVTDAGLTATGATFSASSTVSFSGQVATFTDTNANAPLSDFTTGTGGATIDWGDGSMSSTGTVSQPGGAGTVFVVTGSHTYNQNGLLTLHVTITDLGGSSASATTTAYVSSPGLPPTGIPVNAVQDISFSGLVASFIDTDPNAPLADFTTGNSGATIDWGDGSSARVGTVTQPGGMGTVFLVSGSHTYTEEGAYLVTVNIVDLDGDTAITTTTASVVDAPLTATGAVVQALEGTLFSGQAASFTDAEPNAPLTDFTSGGGGATINWGDGSSFSSGTITQPGGVGTPFLVSASHSYPEEGIYNVSVTIHDAEGSQTMSMSTASVADAPLTGSSVAVQAFREAPFIGAVATFTDSNANAPLADFTSGAGGATINWGDGTSASAGTVTQPGGRGTVFVVTGSHTYVAEGTYIISVSIMDTGGKTTSDTDNVIVRKRDDLIGRWPQAGQWWVSSSNGSNSFSNSLFATWSTAATWVDAVTGDFNGDGHTDVAARDQATGNWWVGLSNGTSFTASLWTNWSTAATWVDVKVGDFTGDGKDDILARYQQAGQWWLATSTGSSFTNSLWATWSTAVTWVDVKAGDFNGDGKMDITSRWLQGGSWWTSVSMGSTSAMTSQWALWSTGVTWVDINVGDFNGDGKSDIVGRAAQTGQWWAGISNGSSFATGLWATWSPAATWVDVQVGDFTGDGKADLMGRWAEAGQWWAATSTGSSFTNSLWGTWSPAATWIDVQVGDFNNDGKTDIVGRWLEAGSWWAGISTGSTFSTGLWASWSTAVNWSDVHVGDFG
jgi:hypothetical protein